MRLSLLYRLPLICSLASEDISTQKQKEKKERQRSSEVPRVKNYACKRAHTHVKDSVVHVYPSSVDYGNNEITQHALKVSASSDCRRS